MRLHYIQHNPFEDPANIALWAEDSGHDVFGTKIFAGERLPKDADFDLLLVLGGEMNIYQEDLYPWLAEEKRFIRRAMDSKKTILGICLGAQLISDILGGMVHKNRYREIGWHEVKLNRAAFSSSAFKGFLIDSRHFNGMGIHLTCLEERLGWHRLQPALTRPLRSGEMLDCNFIWSRPGKAYEG